MYNKGERKEKIFASKAVKAEEKRERKREREREREKNAHLPDFFKVGAYVAHRRCRHCCVTFAKGVCEQQTCGGQIEVEKEEQKERNLSKNEKDTFLRTRLLVLLVCMHDAPYTISLSHSLTLTHSLNINDL
jgi:hypothetical protein